MTRKAHPRIRIADRWLVLAFTAALACWAAGAGCGVSGGASEGMGGVSTQAGGSKGGLSASGGAAQSSPGSGGWQGLGGSSRSEDSGGNYGGVAGGGGGGGGGGAADAEAGTPDASAMVVDVAAGALCAQLSALQCEAEASCCKAPGRTVEACKGAMAKKCADLYLDQVSKSPVSGYAPHATGLAMAEFQRRATTCDPTIVTWGASVHGLRGIFPGTQGQGTDCTPKSLLDAGDAAAHLMACQNPADVACLPGGTWACVARAGLAGPCFSDTNCQDGFYCDNPLNSLTGATCKTRREVGASCKAGGQCASFVCKRAVCVPADTQSVYCLSDG